MFRSLKRKWYPNYFDRQIEKHKDAKKILIVWNRGLGDLPLGLFAIIERIYALIPGSEITFLTRTDLLDPFLLFPHVKAIGDPAMKRGVPYKAHVTGYDWVIDQISPTDAAAWQKEWIVPRLTWNEAFYRPSPLPRGYNYVGVHAFAETGYAPWRNVPAKKWEELFAYTKERRTDIRFVLLGHEKSPSLTCDNVIDLRGKTDFFTLLSLIKEVFYALVVPDSGIQSMAYFLDAPFPLRLVSLFADPNQSILKQKVPSPNRCLEYRPLVLSDLSKIEIPTLFEAIFSALHHEPLLIASPPTNAPLPSDVGAVILAGGQGSRLGISGPKGLVEVGGKTLFRHLLDKCSGPTALLVSPENREQTREAVGDIPLITQTTLPLLSLSFEEGEEAPDGNGALLGLDLPDAAYIQVTPIDNPLANPFDAALLSHLASHPEIDVVIQAVKRIPHESMGGITAKGLISEYIHIGPNDPYLFSYTGVFAARRAFLMQRNKRFWHFVKKEWKGKAVYKREQFLFDAFKTARGIHVIVVPRDTSYAPIKGAKDLLHFPMPISRPPE